MLPNLNRNSGGTVSDAGWQLVGNPYPSLLDYSLVATGLYTLHLNTSAGVVVKKLVVQ